jgi:hypothetical protein
MLTTRLVLAGCDRTVWISSVVGMWCGNGQPTQCQAAHGTPASSTASPPAASAARSSLPRPPATVAAIPTAVLPWPVTARSLG